MKNRIYITYEGMTEAEACKYAGAALQSNEPHTGIVTWKDGTVLAFSDYTKNTAITVWREKK